MKYNKDAGSFKRKSKDMINVDRTFLDEFEAFTLSKKCMALAGPQVGKFERIINIKTKDKKKVITLCNPSIVRQSKKLTSSAEHCLLPNAPQTLNKVRPKWIIVEYYDPKLDRVRKRVFSKRRAAAVCHCLEILDGTLLDKV